MYCAQFFDRISEFFQKLLRNSLSWWSMRSTNAVHPGETLYMRVCASVDFRLVTLEPYTIDYTVHRPSYSSAMKIIAAIMFLASLGATAAAAERTTITGTVTHVRDGDTIEVGEVPIRMNGVSAPELDEPLGERAKKFMLDLVMGQPVRCELNGQKSYDRFVGICYLRDKDIGLSVIEAGLALDCPRYSGGRYVDLEQAVARERIKLPKYCE